MAASCSLHIGMQVLFSLPMRQLIALTTFFRQHALTIRGVGGYTRQAGFKRITLRPDGCTIAAFRDGCPDHALMKLFHRPGNFVRQSSLSHRWNRSRSWPGTPSGSRTAQRRLPRSCSATPMSLLMSAASRPDPRHNQLLPPTARRNRYS